MHVSSEQASTICRSEMTDPPKGWGHVPISRCSAPQKVLPGIHFSFEQLSRKFKKFQAFDSSQIVFYMPDDPLVE